MTSGRYHASVGFLALNCGSGDSLVSDAKREGLLDVTGHGRQEKMPMPELTRDEQFIRSYYLSTDFTRARAVRSELGFVLPVLILACFALVKDAHDAMWVAFLYMLCLYFWRMGSGRWGRATRSLIEKYEERLGEFEPTASR